MESQLRTGADVEQEVVRTNDRVRYITIMLHGRWRPAIFYYFLTIYTVGQIHSENVLIYCTVRGTVSYNCRFFRAGSSIGTYVRSTYV